MKKIALLTFSVCLVSVAHAGTSSSKESTSPQSYLKYLNHPVFGDQVKGEELVIKNAVHLFIVWSSPETKLCYTSGKQRSAIAQIRRLQTKYADYGMVDQGSEDVTSITAKLGWNWESTEDEQTQSISPCPNGI